MSPERVLPEPEDEQQQQPPQELGAGPGPGPVPAHWSSEDDDEEEDEEEEEESGGGPESPSPGGGYQYLPLSQEPGPGGAAEPDIGERLQVDQLCPARYTTGTSTPLVSRKVAWVSSGCTGFLLQSKDVHVRWTGHAKLPIVIMDVQA
eukprot:g38561.t1